MLSVETRTVVPRKVRSHSSIASHRSSSGERFQRPHCVHTAQSRPFAASNASRRMRARGTLRIGGPRTASESLYLGVFETRDVWPVVRADGVECALAVAHRDNDLTEFRVSLPAQAAGRKLMDVAIESPRPLLFGYAEVR